MKNRQIRLIIGVLVGLVLFSSSLALLFYTKQESKDAKKQELSAVIVASKKINTGEIIASSDIKEIMLPRSYVGEISLAPEEIIGRYASVDIFEEEIIRSQKISLEAPQKVVQNVAQTQEQNSSRNETQPKLQKAVAEHDTVMLPLSLFQNLDTTLTKGEHIDIVSTVPIMEQTQLNSGERMFRTKYVATNIEIDSFVFGANSANTLVSTNKDGGLIFADSVVLVMKPQELENFFSTYYKTQELNANRVYNTAQTNKGHLWMVKCAQNDTMLTKADKERRMVNFVALQTKKVIQQRKIAKKEQVSISYEE